ncbi:MAG: hypothetical protein AB7P99_05695 [Vicinamibacterales bacterium]
MTKKTRLFLLIAAGVLVAGLGTGLVASYMGVQTLSLIGADGPAELAYMPADARLLGYADVQAVMNSEFRQRIRDLNPRDQQGDDLRDRTGINIETDVDHVVVAFLGASSENQRPLAAARGRFDEVRIESFVRERGAQAEDYKGERLFVMTEDDGDSLALSFVEPGLALFGEAAAVRLGIDTKAGSTNMTDNGELMALVRDVEDGTAWAVGRFDAIAADRIPQGVADQLPAINLFAASGHINGGIQATLRAETRDDMAAQNLRDVVRGFIALARLQVGTNEQLVTLLNSVQLAGDGRTVALSVTIPADALNLIAPRREREQARATVQ